MQNVIAFGEGRHWNRRHWNVAGKGPSFDPRCIDRTTHTVCLNHTIREAARCTLFHAVDLEALIDCEPWLDRCRYVVMPWQPNQQSKIGPAILPELIRVCRLLRDLNDAGRLLHYDRAECPRKSDYASNVRCTFFSAEAVFGFLSQIGVKQITSTGIDGGTDYAGEFSDLTPLTNGQPNFDKQLPRLRSICDANGIRWARIERTPSARAGEVPAGL